MPITFNDFHHLATAAPKDTRDVVVNSAKTPQSVQFGSRVFSTSKKLNDATMAAFKEALQKEYGVFGLHAFDTVVGTRAQLHKSLRACDIKKIVSSMESLKQMRFTNELDRQLQTSPLLLQSGGKPMANEIRQIVNDHLDDINHLLEECKTPEDIAELVDASIKRALPEAQERLRNSPDIQAFRPLHHGEKQVESGSTPMGLSKLHSTATYRGPSTSVEDHVKSGSMGTGMRINDSHLRPAVFEKLKTNGVEPGFIYHNDWSQHDSRALLTDIHSPATQTSFNQFLTDNPQFQPDPQQNPPPSFLEIGLKVGRAHPAGVAFAAEYVLSKELDKLEQDPKQDSPLLQAIRQSFPNAQKTDFPPDGAQATPQQLANLEKLKKDCFIQLRDAVMTYGKTAAKTDPNSQLPIFKHFTDRHILKLDYNEGNRVSPEGAASTGEFRLPERVRDKGYFYYHRRVTTADKASIGAVSEAFANDLTRLLGVPAQDLTLVRGQYSDGHPKIMLEAKFAEGYHDFEDGFIEDGRTVGNVEALGRFKAIFLALADRDAIGSHGQNKGVINGKFFAIDPGHSLEGSGAKLAIQDNLSFVDTDFRSRHKVIDHFTKRFRNYTVFDDDTRFAKMQGVLTLRQMCAGHPNAIDKLSEDYKAAFNPNEPGISPEEKAIRQQTCEQITSMTTEFQTQVNRIIDICDDQLKLYDALGENDATKPLQEGAIETIENLEKLTSPTTWMSKEGKVELKHLSVPEKTRIPWTAKKDENGMLVYTSKKPLSSEAQTRLLQQMYGAPNSAEIHIGKDGMATIKVPVGDAQYLFNAFSEDKIAKIKHPEEVQRRADVAAAKAKFQQDTAETAVNLEKLISPTTWHGAPNAPNERFLTINQGTSIPWTVETKDGDLVFTSSGPIQDQSALERLMKQLNKNLPARFHFDTHSKATIKVPVKQAQVFFDAFSEQEIAKVKHPTHFQQYVAQAANPPAGQQPNVQPPPAGVQPPPPNVPPQ
ncbi:MAG: hypothetical protein IKZ46_00485 [Victivallales bacterium]|nr:hypothetical protein [Victivallales bacterium]